MSTLKSIANRINPPVLIGQDLGTRSNEFWMLNQQGGVDYKFAYSGYHSALNAYRKCAPLNAIISKKARAYVNGKTRIVNTKGKAKGKDSTSEYTNKIKKLLANPNPFQSQKEFEAQEYTYVQLYGWSLRLFIKPVGLPRSDARKMWNISPSLVDVEETKANWLLAETNKDIIKSIVLVLDKERVPIPLDDIYIVTDFTPTIDSPVFPEGRIRAHEMQINNIIGAYESRNVLINYRGALGIISPETKDVGGAIKLKDSDKEQLQSDFRQYGLRNSQWQFIISSAAVKWSQMGVATKDLLLFEEIEDDIMRLCDGWDFPYPLMSSNRTNNLGGNNIGESKTLLYQDAIFPEAENLCDQWAKMFDIEDTDTEFIKDYSHVAALQGDEQKKAQARKTRNEAFLIEFMNNLLTLNEWRGNNNCEALPKAETGEDYGNMYYYQLIALGWKFGSTGAAAPTEDNKDKAKTETV